MFVIQQLLIVVAIFAGIYFNPLDDSGTQITVPESLAIAYSLSCLGQPLVEQLAERFLIAELPLIRYSPYVLLGFLWRQVLHYVLQTLLGG